MGERGYCKTCGRPTEWDDRAYVDEDGNVEGDYEPYCGPCEDAGIERAQKIRRWALYHPGEKCPESELE